MTTPNPGSREAQALGCRCPILDNHHGWGYWAEGVFVINGNCPIHARPPTAEPFIDVPLSKEVGKSMFAPEED